jgi:molybdenum cofactor sulfurtransferase
MQWQCNMTGKKYPLHWVQDFQSGENRLRNAGSHVPAWYVLLDASALVGTAPLDLSATPADFVCLSFYKMFGLPTGLGALLVRKPALAVLRKTYFGGGSVTAYRSRESFHVFAANDVATFEDGTLPFQQILALEVSLARLGC